MKRLFCIFLALCISFSLSYSSFANQAFVKDICYCSNGISGKIAQNVLSFPSKEGDKYLVMITRKNIDENSLAEVLYKQYGYTLDKFDHMSSNPDPTIYDDYVTSKRKVLESLYTTEAETFISDMTIENRDILYVGSYTGSIIAYVTAEKIEELSHSDYVNRILPFEDAIEETSLYIAPEQVGADSISGTKSSSYNSGNGYKGNSVKIGILEPQGGVFDHNHIQLSSIYNVSLFKKNNYRNDGTTVPMQIKSHATKVTSIIVGQSITVDGRNYEGIVPNATVYQMPVLTSTDVINGFTQLVNYGVSIINYSGGYNNNSAYTSYDLEVDTLIRNTGVTFVVAAGNNGESSRNINSPAKAYNAITVGNAVTKTGKLSTATVPYSINSSSSYVEDSYLTNKPEVCAPGTKLAFVESLNSIVSISGTSFSAPIVTGIVSQIHQSKTTLKDKPVGTKAVLLAGASNSVISLSGNAPCYNAYFRNKSGAGFINAPISVSTAINANYRNVTVDLHDYSPTGQFTWNSVHLDAGETIHAVLTFHKADDNLVLSSGYAHNIDLRLINSSGNTLDSSLSPYNNVEIIEYTATVSGNYRLRALINTGSYISQPVTMKFSVAWIIN